MPESMDLLQGTLDVLVLRALARGPRHGYAVSRWVRERTGGALQIEDAPLYKALRRLEEAGCVSASWGASEHNRRARYYRLTVKGRQAAARQGIRMAAVRGRRLRRAVLMTGGSRPRVPDDRRDDVDAEVQFHLDARIVDLVADGMTPEGARAQALREFGDVDDARRYMRGVEHRVQAASRRERYMDDLRRDLAYALRRLRAAPAFAFTAVLTMALGIGANTAIFSIVNGVLLRPLPFHDPDRLFAVYSSNRTGGLLQASVSAVDLDDWRAERQSIEDIGGYLYGEGSTGVDLTGRGDPRRLSAVFVSPGFFSTLGVTPQAGRLPREDEMVRGGPDTVVMITAGFWSREFGASPSVVGSTITLKGEPYEVLGVLPEHFRFPTGEADVFVPYSTIPTPASRASAPFVCCTSSRGPNGRDEAASSPNDGTTAPACLPVSRGSRVGRGDSRAACRVVTGPVRAGCWCSPARSGSCCSLRASTSPGCSWRARWGAAGDRRPCCPRRATRPAGPEAAHRESRLLAVGGAGPGLAKLGIAGCSRWRDNCRARPRSSRGAVATFALGLALATGLLFGLVPALRTSSSDAQLVLQDTRRGVAGPGRAPPRRAGRRGSRAGDDACRRRGLMARSFLALLKVDSGFRPDHLIAVQFTIDPTGTAAAAPAPARARAARLATALRREAIDKVRALPGVVPPPR